MTKFYKKIFAFILHYSGVNFLCSFFLHNHIFVLNYHSISDVKKNNIFLSSLYKNLSVSIDQFEKQVIFLKKHGHSFITFSDLDKITLYNIKKPTIIYFDDGFKDILENALPILKKYNISAVVFVSSGIADRTHFLWTLKYKYFLLNKGLSEKEADKNISNLKNISDVKKDMYLEKIYKNENFVFDYSKQNIFLNWDEIKVLSDSGWEIGSHGVSHDRLTECNDNSLHDEIYQSKAILENNLNKIIKSFSYPHGRNNDKVNDNIKKAGYMYIVSIGNGLNKVNNLNENFNIFRNISAKPSDRFYEFAVKIYANNFLRKS